MEFHRIIGDVESFFSEPSGKASVTPKVVISQAGVLDLVAAYEAHLGQGAVRDFLGSSVAGRREICCVASVALIGCEQEVEWYAEVKWILGGALLACWIWA